MTISWRIFFQFFAPFSNTVAKSPSCLLCAQLQFHNRPTICSQGSRTLQKEKSYPIVMIYKCSQAIILVLWSSLSSHRSQNRKDKWQCFTVYLRKNQDVNELQLNMTFPFRYFQRWVALFDRANRIYAWYIELISWLNQESQYESPNLTIFLLCHNTKSLSFCLFPKYLHILQSRCYSHLFISISLFLWSLSHNFPHESSIRAIWLQCHR